MNYKALVKQLRLDLLRGEDRANWFHQIYEATEAIESLIADCVRKDEARERANKQAQQWEGRCKALEAELAQVKQERDAAMDDLADLNGDLISRKELLKKAWDADTRRGYVQVVDVGDIEEAPAIDPVHAAGSRYCRECENWGEKGLCEVLFCWTNADDFCSYGIKEEEPQ